MTLKDELKEKVGKIAETLEAIGQNGIIAEDIELVLSGINFSDETVKLIQSKASPTLRKMFSEDYQPAQTTAQTLRHAFADPIKKNATYLKMIEDGHLHGDMAFRVLLDTKRCLENIRHNYPLLMDGETERSIENAFNEYSKVIAELDPLINTLSAELELDPDNIEQPGEGLDCFSKLPDDFSL